MLADIVAKLNPGVLRVSPKFCAMLAFILDQDGWTSPTIESLTITSDGILLTDMGNSIIGSADDLERNLRGVAECVGLTKAQTDYLFARYRARTTDWRTSAYVSFADEGPNGD